MKKWILQGFAITALALSTSSWANADFNNAKNLIENWFAAMKNNQADKAAGFLAPQFVSIHTDGIVRNKTQEVALIKNLHMKDYHLTSFKFSQSGNSIVVTYKDEGAEKIDNKSIATQPAGRMAVLQKQGNQWFILAYANLDKIG